MSSFLYKKSGMEFSSIPESVYPKLQAFRKVRNKIKDNISELVQNYK